MPAGRRVDAPGRGADADRRRAPAVVLHCSMTRDTGPSRATPEGQLLALVDGLTSLRGRRRTLARVVCGLVLLAGAAAATIGGAQAVAGAFG